MANEKGHQSRIYIQDVDGGVARPITPERTGLRIGMSPVSPDGKLVFGMHSPGNASLYPVEGGEARPVPGLEAKEFLLQWSADGHSLYVHKVDGAPNKAWLVDPASGARRAWREIAPPESVSVLPQLVIARDGQSCVYGTQRVLSELYLIEGLR
jgi:hypothetical protein